MSQGQAERPIESTDGTKATLVSTGDGRTVLLVLDPETREELTRIRVGMERVVELLELLADTAD
jgi:hypothetical protein